jgi:hypothetical protein
MVFDLGPAITDDEVRNGSSRDLAKVVCRKQIDLRMGLLRKPTAFETYV